MPIRSKTKSEKYMGVSRNHFFWVADRGCFLAIKIIVLTVIIFSLKTTQHSACIFIYYVRENS